MKRSMALLLSVLVLLLALPALQASADGEIRKHVLLIDGSGSMDDDTDGVYFYKTGKLAKFVKDLVSVHQAFAPTDQIEIAIFSKTDPEKNIKSPQWIYKGTVANLSTGFPEMKPQYGWTALVASLDAGLEAVKSHKGPQLIWLLTDNIDQETDQTDSTDAFYKNLAGREDIDRIYVFPVDLAERRGLVLYGMARQRSERDRQEDGQVLDRVVAAVNGSTLKSLLGDGGFLVHPLADQGLDIKVIGFTPDPASAQGSSFAVDPATGAISLTGFGEDRPIRGTFTIELTSLFAALKIVDANVEAEIFNVTSGDFSLPGVITQTITPNKITLAPGQKAQYTIALDIPAPSVTWNPFHDPALPFEETGSIRGDLRIVVKDVQYATTQPDKFFKVTRIPETLGNRSKHPIYVAAPMAMDVELPIWRAWVIVGTPVVIALLLFAVYLLTAGRAYVVRVWTVHWERKVRVSRSSKLVIPDQLGTVQTTAFGELVFIPDPSMKHEKARPLRGRRGEVVLQDGRRFFWELPQPSSSKQPRGGTIRGRMAR